MIRSPGKSTWHGSSCQSRLSSCVCTLQCGFSISPSPPEPPAHVPAKPVLLSVQSNPDDVLRWRLGTSYIQRQFPPPHDTSWTAPCSSGHSVPEFHSTFSSLAVQSSVPSEAVIFKKSTGTLPHMRICQFRRALPVELVAFQCNFPHHNWSFMFPGISLRFLSSMSSSPRR